MGYDLEPSHHHHYYHTDNSAVERIEKLRREDEAKFQMQIAKLEQEKKKLKNYMYDSINKILQETKNQNQLLKREYEQQKIEIEMLKEQIYKMKKI